MMNFSKRLFLCKNYLNSSARFGSLKNFRLALFSSSNNKNNKIVIDELVTGEDLECGVIKAKEIKSQEGNKIRKEEKFTGDVSQIHRDSTTDQIGEILSETRYTDHKASFIKEKEGKESKESKDKK